MNRLRAVGTDPPLFFGLPYRLAFRSGFPGAQVDARVAQADGAQGAALPDSGIVTRGCVNLNGYSFCTVWH
ncbi:hypothetical protein AB0A71_14220 [Kitasatospora aureofaciens]|uniref:hypothetical protein n=1 Tax=Kitasatospora aureofaciens TaxID=1894 RepID=UPI0033DC9D67